MSVVEPEIKGTISNRYSFMSDYMSYPIEIIIENINKNKFIIHFRTIPPGMNDIQIEYWSDVMYEEERIKNWNKNKLWVSLVPESNNINETQEIADYCSEVYYDIYNHHDV